MTWADGGPRNYVKDDHHLFDHKTGRRIDTSAGHRDESTGEWYTSARERRDIHKRAVDRDNAEAVRRGRPANYRIARSPDCD